MTSRAAWSLVVFLLASASRAGAGGGEETMGTAARTYFDSGMVLFEQHRYEESIREFQAGFAVEPRRQFLFAWAQAARLGGDCRAAAATYARFLATEPKLVQAEAARMGLARCQARAEAPPEAHAVSPPLAVAPSPPGLAPAEPRGPAVATTAPPIDTTSRPDLVVDRTTDSRPTRARRTRRLWIGLTVGGVALAGLAVGLGVGLRPTTIAFPSRATPAVDFRTP